MGPIFFLNSTCCFNPYGNINISEKIMAASKLNLLRGCSVISAAKLEFKHN